MLKTNWNRRVVNIVIYCAAVSESVMGKFGFGTNNEQIAWPNKKSHINRMDDTYSKICLLLNGTSVIFKLLVPRIVKIKHLWHVKKDLKPMSC